MEKHRAICAGRPAAYASRLTKTAALGRWQTFHPTPGADLSQV